MLRESRLTVAAPYAKPGSAAKTVTAADKLARCVTQVINKHVSRGVHLCVGLSGGVDSVALLDVLVAAAPRYQWQVSAIHVNHQLSPNAVAWVRFCRRFCRERGVPLRVVKVDVPRGNSVEAAAREARYAAYRRQPAQYMVLAQHQDDQAETILLQLLRGAGVKGLAAMPVVRADALRPGLRLLRPMLDVTRRDIERYAAHHNLKWVEDESNDDAYYLRNFVRREIMPRLETRVPAYRVTLMRAAAQLAEAAQLLDALAKIDGEGALIADTLAVATLAQLSDARARNLLRYFIRTQGVRMPDARRLDEALRQTLTAKVDARVCVSLGAHMLRRHRGNLHVVPVQPPLDSGFSRAWREERRVVIPEWHGVLEMRRCRGAGIDLAKLLAAPVTLRTRRGGESLQPDAARPRRTIKYLFQALG
ncbi:MAG TPA: tRNA lysidine(34) synthetase TilS, partial [Burkholderiales bacterium]|nr:tRNA lysidine(34) synthetase TilS [Burkholderiales bacterium]